MPAPLPALVSAARRLGAPLLALLLGLGLTGAEAMSPEQTMSLCRDAAIAAADRNGVPREVMLAITQVETRTKRGGRTGPWPWTVNVAGKGAWFDSRAAALLRRAAVDDARLVDVDVALDEARTGEPGPGIVGGRLCGKPAADCGNLSAGNSNVQGAVGETVGNESVADNEIHALTPLA